MESAAPPRASPSILVRITPVTWSRSSKPCAMRTASWPVMPSATKRISSGWIACFRRSSSPIISSSICSRPAVSTMTTRSRARFAALAEHRRELVIDDLDELLRRRDGAQLRDADGLLLDALEKFARELEVDVGLEEDAPDLAQSLFNVGFVEDAASTQPRKRCLE